MNISKAICYYILLFCYAITFASCHNHTVPQDNRSVATLLPTSPLNREVKDANGTPVLLGTCTRSGLEQAPYNAWFDKNYADYQVDSATANRLRTALAGKRFTIFMGTWCGDSRREVPRIFKILDYCGIDPSAIQLVMVSAADSTYKQSPGHEERGLGIFKVPDLLVIDHRKELGRVVESPVVSLEKDLLNIAEGAAYTPQYPGANRLIQAFREEKTKKIEQELPEWTARLRTLVHSPSELNVYAHVMQRAGEEEKASIILKINRLIFPDQK